MSALILDWADAAAAGTAQAGGKGWQLGRLAQLGLPVPPGFVISAAASAGHRPGAALPGPLGAALVQALAARGWERQPLAVRSSATLEDSGQASFAGIHRSCLNVPGAAGVAAALQQVLDSCWSAPAQAYRQRLGLSEAEAGMAVVVMPLLPARASGIAFTCDPVGGRNDQTLIHAHWGLGESLVGGHAEGDEYRLQEQELDGSLSLCSIRLGGKARLSVVLPEGGTALQDTPQAQRGQAVLSAAQALALGELVRDAARALDHAAPGYDLEWVWDGNQFWIVQARPVTARGHHTYLALAAQAVYWSRGNTREILPEPLSPLDWELSRVMVNRMLTRGYALCGYPLLSGAQRAGLFHGRLYLQTSLLQWECYDALGVTPKAMNQLMGGTQPEIAVPRPDWRARAARALRMLRYLRRNAGLRRRAERLLRDARREADAWMAEPLPADNGALAARLRQQLTTLLGSDDLFFLQGSGGGTLFNLVQLIDRACPGEGHALAAALLAGGEPSVTARQSYQLMELARIAGTDTAALDWLRNPARVAGDWAQALPPDSPFRRAFADFLNRYGHRGLYETYLRNPRWREAPGYLLDSVVNLLGCEPAPLRARQLEAADQAWQRLRRALPLWSRPLLKPMVEAARRDCNQREAARSALVAYLAALRHCACELGRRLSGPAGLAQPDDLFNLTSAEILALATGHLPGPAAARRATERGTRLAHWASQREPELVIEHAPAEYRNPSATAATPVAAGEHWHGIAVGSGCARGRVRIVREPSAGLGMAPGEVLVAPSTDPGWTPLFVKAGALIMETGGYLSHGAIVAREFGIPAVVNLPGILAQLRDGDEVEVDGRAGTVKRIHVAT
ncbi:PEP-utilizing enzyme [Chitiniphilus purpureus]|uniref:PEP-utilizing enzyme n=1 Tax=Chitiniphilus purpureus TaxID=2981137 RepID=A0ABY6DH35_9NEIS|nr:PEP/pyruvate-binding domain-containing protein [Chitiniphilus sp. CD1]UXY13654.1 PEP-utilizing enzyme [Chitiniphilus sp. CD1]